MALAFERDGDDILHLDATELRLGLPGTTSTEEFPTTTAKCHKRSFTDMNDESDPPRNNSEVFNEKKGVQEIAAPPSKTQVVGWPPIRSYRKNCFQAKKTDPAEAAGNGIYVKVSMDGAPYLRKIDLKVYNCYPELFKALEDMFKFTVGKFSERDGYNGSEFVPTYEDKDGDWMLVGDVPWNMFINSCKKLRIMKGSEARGLGCIAV